NEKLRARQDSANSDLNAVFKRPALPSFLIKAQQCFKVLGIRRTPVDAPRNRREDLLRAGFVLSGAGRRACKDLRDAARGGGTLNGKRSLNLQKTDVRIDREARDTAVFQHATCGRLGQD